MACRERWLHWPIRTIGSIIWLLALLGYFAHADLAQADDAVCSEVKIVIEQKLSLERQAFEAKMVITNALPDQTLENVSIELQFLDANNNSVVASADPNATDAAFFYRTDLLDGITSLSGGSVNPKSAATIHWLIIPAAGTGGTLASGTLYYIGARVSYTLEGQNNTVDVIPEYIVVRPQPLLELDYFLPKEVYGDDAFTPETEPSEPFTLGVRIKNTGAGISYNTSIDTAQPKIVENDQGLLVGFEILSGYVADEPVGKSLLLDFGDIAGGGSAVGRWNMISTLSGRFVEFNASFTHADDLGGAVTSLLGAVSTHTLVHDVKVALTGRDHIRDFLARDGDVLRVYESEGVDNQVSDQTAQALLTSLGNNTSKLVFPAVANGFAYARVSDPGRGGKGIGQVVRSDGYILPSENAWLSKERDTYLKWHYYINIFDVDTTGEYTIRFTEATTGELSGLVYNDVNGNGLYDPAEPPIAVQSVSLQGIESSSGGSVLATAYTDAQGQYSFTGLKPGSYSLSVGEAAGLVNGVALAGEAGGTAQPGRISGIEIGAGTLAQGYVFSKRAGAAFPDPGQSADLSVKLNATPSLIKLGEQVSVTVTAGNAGPGDVADASVVISIPEEFSVKSHQTTSGSYENGVWKPAKLVEGDSADLSITLEAVSRKRLDLTLQASVGSSMTDSRTDNNSAFALVRLDEEEAITAEQQLSQGMRILALLACADGDAPECIDDKQDAAKTYFAARQIEAKIVTTAEDYRRLLRSGVYNVIWLNGDMAALGEQLLEETRAGIFRGASLIVDGAPGVQSRIIAQWWDGRYPDQPLGNSVAVMIDGNPVNTTGVSWSLESATAFPVATYASGENAVVKTHFGLGYILTAGIDVWAGNSQSAELAEFIAGELELLQPQIIEPMLALAPVVLKTHLLNGTADSQNLQLTSRWANGITLTSSEPVADEQDADKAVWIQNLAGNAQHQVLAQLRLPAISVASTIVSSVVDTDGGEELQSWTFPVRTVDLATIQTNVFALLDSLTGDAAAQPVFDTVRSLLAQAQTLQARSEIGEAIIALTEAGKTLSTVSEHHAYQSLQLYISQWLGLLSAQWDESSDPQLFLQPVTGNGQSAYINTAFAEPLQVRVTDEQGTAQAGLSVTFTLPDGGASAGFAGGAVQVQMLTDGQGIATSTVLNANAVAGNFKAIAGVAGAAQSAEFTLTNLTPGTVVLMIEPVSGDAQSAPINTAFAQNLRVRVTDASAQPVAAQPVTFTLPASGASALFADGGMQILVHTDAQGMAESSLLTANAHVGSYQITASVAGALQPARFTLTNTAADTGRQMIMDTATGTGTVRVSISGGGEQCRFNPEKTMVRRPEGVLPLFEVLFFPHGVLDFELIDCDPSSTVTVKTEWPHLLNVTGYLKYGPTPRSAGHKLWYPPANLKLDGRAVSYTITDGQLGDDDLTVNGVIRDPGGPVIQAGPLPGVSARMLGKSGLALLALLLATAAVCSTKCRWYRRLTLRVRQH